MQTVLSAAFSQARADIDRMMVRNAARICLERTKGNAERAAALLATTATRDIGLLVALIGRQEIERRAAEMVAAMNFDSNGQSRFAMQATNAVPSLSKPNAVSEGHAPLAKPAGITVPSETAHPRSDDGRHTTAGPAVPLPPSSDHPIAAGGQPVHAAQARNALPPAATRRPPNPARGLAAIAAVQPTMARSVLDTYRIRDGRPIGDVSWGEIGGLIVANDREARVLRAIRMHIADAPADALVREIVRANVIEAALTEVPENV